MMYANKLAAAIKVNGKILREFGDTVYVPFGSEYSITLKNLNNARALVFIHIDGESQFPYGIVLNANQSVDIERGAKNYNLNKGNKFKFIERTGKIEDHRGIKLEDGLIAISYQFETPPVLSYVSKDTFTFNSDNISGGIMRGLGGQGGGGPSKGYGSGAMASPQGSFTTTSASFQNVSGITVAGSESKQTFGTTTIGALESIAYNLVIKLVGDLGNNKPVDKPFTVKSKVECSSCGRKNRHNAKFCTECGTALEIYA